MLLPTQKLFVFSRTFSAFLTRTIRSGSKVELFMRRTKLGLLSQVRLNEFGWSNTFYPLASDGYIERQLSKRLSHNCIVLEDVVINLLNQC